MLKFVKKIIKKLWPAVINCHFTTYYIAILHECSIRNPTVVQQ